MEFKYSEIGDSNLIDKLNEKIIMDLLKVRSASVADTTMIHKWTKDYKKRGVPFIVTHTPKKGVNGRVTDWTTLWVEEDAPPLLNYSIPRKEIKFNIKNCKG